LREKISRGQSQPGLPMSRGIGIEAGMATRYAEHQDLG
jgi:hypothetical protein